MSTSVRIDFLREKFAELERTSAWSGLVEFQSSAPDQVVIRTANRFTRDWMREHFASTLQGRMEALPGNPVSVQFVIEVLSNIPQRPDDASFAAPRRADESFAEPAPATHSERPAIEKSVFHESLKPKYTFHNFVVGPANQFAHAAAQAVARLPGENYNPLFIYGGVGLGKTHLLNAIGMQTLSSKSQARVIFVSSEKFTNELIYCLRYNKMSDFRKKYRDQCDVLLIDDIQFIAGKERTQEEFFHTFNHLHDGKCQIVMTSDRPPREIPDLEERLRSRFEWGLLADIQVPDLETRVAILKRKAEEDNIVVDDEVMFFLATHIKSNVRELEGSLIRLNALASLGGKKITVDYAKDALKNVLGGIDRVLTVEQVQKTVAEFFNLKMAELTGKRRMKNLAFPRQIAMYLCRKHVQSSFPEIGNKFGGKDHSTVVHAFSKIRKVLETDPVVREQIASLEHNLSI